MYFLISLDIEVLPLFIVYQLARYESKFWKIFLLKLYITITNRILIIGGHCVKYELYLPLLNARGHSYELSFVYLWLIFQLDCTAQQNYLLQPLNHWNDTKYIRSLFTNLYDVKYDPQKYDTAASIHLRYVWGSSFLATIRFPSASSPNGRVLVKYLEALLILGCFKTASGLSWRFTSSTWPGSKRLIFCYI